MAKAVTIEQLDKDLVEGKITREKYKAIKTYILSRPTRENGATDRNVLKYAQAAGCSPEQMDRVRELCALMNASVDELRTLIGDVVVERKDSHDHKVKGRPLPRWFCNVVPIPAKETEGVEKGVAQ